DKSSLRAFDDLRLLVAARDPKVIEVDGRPVSLDHRLRSYRVLDVSSVRGEAWATRPNDAGAEHGLWAVRLDGSEARRLGMVQVSDAAAWSHDGRRIAFGNVHELSVTDAQGLAVHTIATLSGYMNGVRWSPDDSTLRVDVGQRSDRSATEQQYDVSAEGGELRPVPSGNPMPVSCCGAWIPGSDDYVFEARSDTARRIWVLHGRSGRFWTRPADSFDATPAGSVAFSSPVPSADGSRIFVIGSPAPRLSVYDEARRELIPYLGGINAFA